MRLINPLPNLYFVVFPNRREMLLTMMRVQEFYESPYRTIRNKVFTLEQFLTSYLTRNGVFTYSVWSGFNVPGHIFVQFSQQFEDLTQYEKKLIDLILPNTELLNRFYVIGAEQKDVSTMNHEIAHGLWYLDPNYRKEVTQYLNTVPKKILKDLYKKLKDLKYAPAVFKDEAQAYLGTSSVDFFRRRFRGLTKATHRHRRHLSRIFNSYYKKHQIAKNMVKV